MPKRSPSALNNTLARPEARSTHALTRDVSLMASLDTAGQTHLERNQTSHNALPQGSACLQACAHFLPCLLPLPAPTSPRSPFDFLPPMVLPSHCPRSSPLGSPEAALWEVHTHLPSTLSAHALRDWCPSDGSQTAFASHSVGELIFLFPCPCKPIGDRGPFIFYEHRKHISHAHLMLYSMCSISILNR